MKTSFLEGYVVCLGRFNVKLTREMCAKGQERPSWGRNKKITSDCVMFVRL